MPGTPQKDTPKKTRDEPENTGPSSGTRGRAQRAASLPPKKRSERRKRSQPTKIQSGTPMEESSDSGMDVPASPPGPGSQSPKSSQGRASLGTPTSQGPPSLGTTASEDPVPAVQTTSGATSSSSDPGT